MRMRTPESLVSSRSLPSAVVTARRKLYPRETGESTVSIRAAWSGIGLQFSIVSLSRSQSKCHVTTMSHPVSRTSSRFTPAMSRISPTEKRLYPSIGASPRSTLFHRIVCPWLSVKPGNLALTRTKAVKCSVLFTVFIFPPAGLPSPGHHPSTSQKCAPPATSRQAPVCTPFQVMRPSEQLFAGGAGPPQRSSSEPPPAYDPAHVLRFCAVSATAVAMKKPAVSSSVKSTASYTRPTSESDPSASVKP
mmetsp:Transcript_14533/g.47745  ORF Transcript_14533/g.47745 Transcript_14533/m.47745 type:complete len:248 (-) Transcript_14533:118-861(-)